MPDRTLTNRIFFSGSILIFLVVCVGSAWVADDTYITLRTVDNFVNGYGLRWNVAERVQAYTHPLWMFLLSGAYFFTREAYYTTVVVSIVTTLAAVSLLVSRAAPSIAVGVCSVGLLVASKSFVDYSASGLENPLTHLILILFTTVLCQHLEKRDCLLHLYLIASLGILTRMDTALFYLPALAYSSWRVPAAKLVRTAGLGLLPLLLWELFSLVYYGFPFPNTAYAKLNTSIPAWDLAAQGLLYVENSLIEDPVTLPLVVLSFGISIVSAEKVAYLLSSGSLLYILYVISIGGDFMSGRFFAASLLIAVLTLGRAQIPLRRRAALTVLVITISLLSPKSPLRAWSDDGEKIWLDSGIMDERAFYFDRFGLLRALDGYLEGPRRKPINSEGVKLPQIQAVIGFTGYSWGPEHHIIDIFALANPLLARLPTEDLDWRIGHYRRAVPVGYMETALTGVNTIESPPIRQVYDRLDLVTRGPIWTWDRWAAIGEMNIPWGSNPLEVIHQAQRLTFKARDLITMQKRAEAESCVNAALALDPSSNSAALLAARIGRSQNRLEEAANHILNVFSRIPEANEYADYTEELNNIAIEFVRRGDTNRAEQLMRKTVEIDPDFVSGHMNLGFIAVGRGEPSAAIPHFATALMLIPAVDELIISGMNDRDRPTSILGQLSPLLPLDISNPRHWLDLYSLLTQHVGKIRAGKALIAGLRYVEPDERIYAAILSHTQWLIDEGNLAAAEDFDLIAGGTFLQWHGSR